MAINSKKKGSKFERLIGNWFTKWTRYRFERNRAGSGAWHTNKDSTSDITCTDEKHAHRCKISIECKCYKEIKFEHVLLGNKNCDIIRFWEQATEDAKRGKKVPILCMRYNSMPANEFFFVISTELAKLCNINSKPSMNLVYGDTNLSIYMASSIIKDLDYKKLHKQAKLSLKK